MGDVTNIALPGAVRLYAAAWDPDSIETPPDASVAYGTAWGGGWTELGFTTPDGGTLTHGAEKYEVATAQSMSPVAASRTSETAQITATLLEVTLANFLRAKGLGVLTVGSSTTKLGSDGDDPQIDYITIGMESVAPGSEPGSTPRFRRAYLWKAERDASSELTANLQVEQQLASTFIAYPEAGAPAGYGKLWAVEDQTY